MIITQPLPRAVPPFLPEGIEPAAWNALTPQAQERWHDLTIEDQRHLLGSARARSASTLHASPVEAELARLDANADMATMAALDRRQERQIALARADVPTIRREGSTGYRDTLKECPNKIARTATQTAGADWETEVIELACERRACPVCGPRWAHIWAMNIHHNFVDATAVTVLDVDDMQWETVRKAIARNKSKHDRYVRIPTAEGRSMVVTSTPIPQGKSTHASLGILEAEQALKDVHERASQDRRRVSNSRNFEKPAEVRRGTGDPQDGIVYGQLTKLDTSNLYSELAGIAGSDVDLVTLVKDRDQDLSTAGRWRLSGPPLAMQLALAKAGHRTDAEIEADRSLRRYEREFEEEQRRLERRRRRLAKAAA